MDSKGSERALLKPQRPGHLLDSFTLFLPHINPALFLRHLFSSILSIGNVCRSDSRLQRGQMGRCDFLKWTVYHKKSPVNAHLLRGVEAFPFPPKISLQANGG